MLKSFDDFFGVCHLRDFSRMNEGRQLNCLKSRGNKSTNNFDLQLRRDFLRLKLKAVSRPYLAQVIAAARQGRPAPELPAAV